MNNKTDQLIKEINNDPIINLLKDLCSSKSRLYLVGGFIRDYLLGKHSFDKDIVVLGESAIEYAKKFAEKTNGHFVLLDTKNDIARVVLEDKINYFDFAKCENDDILTDLKRRDFTINSIAMTICGNDKDFLDINNGIKDLENGIIKAISEKNIIDDPLRTLRAFRFAAQFDFEIEKDLYNYIKKHKNLIEKIAPERIHQELIKLFESKACSKNLIAMKKSGLLFNIFPELELQLKVPPNPHHHLGLLDHSIETVRQIELITQTLPDWTQEHLYKEQATGIKYISLLKIAALLHDLGKPATWQIDEQGRHRFIKHDERGAEISESLLKRLKFSKAANKYISKLVRFHIYPSHLTRESTLASDKAIARMFRKLGDETPGIMALAMADRYSALGPEISEKMVSRNISGLFNFLDKYKKSKEKEATIPKLLDGNDVIELLQITKGPKVGKILVALKEAQMENKVNTKKEAEIFIIDLNKKL